MPPELIFYALVAAGLVFWLRSILGTRHGDERERPNSYVSQTENLAEKPEIESAFIGEQQFLSQEDHITELAENPDVVISIANKNAENGLLDISKADRNFDIHQFFNGAQDAFAMIVEAFAEGDREALEDMLASGVYAAFDAAIKEREEREEHQVSEIHAIRKAEIIEAGIQDKKALVTIRFIADETSVTRDKDGEIISGDPDKVTEMHDIWVFGREARSRDPRWFVFETRGDFDGDNETLPNSDG